MHIGISWHRYYDPSTGRYLSPDPIGLEGGDTNLYSYVWQDPINWVDPSGLTGVIPFNPGILSGMGAGAAGFGGTGGVLTPGQWEDMKDDLSLLDPMPMINALGNWFANESNEEGCKQTSDAGKSDPHGDSGRSLEKAEKRVKELEAQLTGANKKDQKKIKQKIQNIIKDAQKKKKGETHWR